MDEALFNNDKCLICGSESFANSGSYMTTIRCKNDCCQYIETDVDSNLVVYEFFIFDSYYIIEEKRDSFGYLIYDKDDEKILSNINDKINYWKEDDRYLTEIMGRGR